MYQVRVFVWQRNPNQPVGLTNLDHAALSICQIVPTRTISIPPAQKGLFSRSIILNPLPTPSINSDGTLGLSANLFPRRISRGMTYSQVTAILGPPNISLNYNNCKAKIGQQILAAIDDSDSSNIAFSEFCQIYNHSIPCCYYLALIAVGKNHTRATQAVRQLKAIGIKREFTASDGTLNNVVIDQTYRGLELVNKLRSIGF